MRGINHALFVGAIAAEPELRYTGGGLAILELTVAGKTSVETDGGEVKQLSFYQRVKALGKFAEALVEQVTKGQVVAVTGRLDYRAWEGDDSVRKSTVETVIESINTLDAEHFTLEPDARSQPVLVEGMNEVTLGGNLTKDAELRYLPTGTAVTNFNIAVNEGFGDKERVGFHRVEAWRTLAEANGEASKGNGIIMTGRLVNESWEDKDGNRQYGTKVEATRLYRVAGKEVRTQAPPAQVERQFESEKNLPF